MAYNFTDVVFSLKGLQPTDKLVLLHLAEHADKDTGECWPGFGRLADFTGLTRRTVIYSINRLGELGLVCNHGMEGGTCTVCGEEIPAIARKTNTYIVRMDKLVATSVAPSTEKAKRKYERTGKYRGTKAKRDRTGKYREVTEPLAVTPTADDVDHLFTQNRCNTCGVLISIPFARLDHIEKKHPELWVEVIQALALQQEVEFLDESKATTPFNIEDEPDELADEPVPPPAVSKPTPPPVPLVHVPPPAPQPVPPPVPLVQIGRAHV